MNKHSKHNTILNLSTLIR